MRNGATEHDAAEHRAGLWHAQPADLVLRRLGVDAGSGLDDTEAAHRRHLFGRNLLPSRPARGPLRRFLSQCNNVLIYLLLAASAITFGIGDHLDAAVILVVVLINAVVGFLQEGNAERALQGIRSLLPFNTTVLREGQGRQLPAAELVPGDIVHLAPGDKVPADVRLTTARGLRIDESALTGESGAVDKNPAPLADDTVIAERSCMAYSGTIVRHGSAAGVVVATGAVTEIGRISSLLNRIEPLDTPLLRKLAAFGRALTGAVLAVGSAMFAYGTLVRGNSVAEMFAAAVGFAVASVPEGLPAVITVTLAIGVRRMARRRAIVRRLPAVEALGAVTVICTDKTGTLTRNEMAVRQVITADGILDVGAAGYAPHGRFTCAGADVDPNTQAHLRGIALACLLCNDAQLHQRGAQWELSGDPTEGALLSMAMKAGLDAVRERAAHPRVDVIPFESEHGYMATLHVSLGGARVFLKGAPERVLPLCDSESRLGRDAPVAVPAWQQRIAVAAGQGMRLIAVAMRAAKAQPAHLNFPDVQAGGFTLLGILAMVDAPREEAVEAVAACLAAGIRVKMITGDHPATAAAIGEQLGFPPPVRTLGGAQIDAMDDAALGAVLAATDVFARATPEHKLRLVRALQAGGAVVAMTGDGVNDAPALKRADVGVAMGGKGTEAAKEAAQIVLADDNFATLAASVEEGRVVYDNIRKSIVFTLPTNGGEAGMLMLAVLLGITLPVTPVQILWVNMITEVSLSLALAFEPPEENVMRRAPRDPGEPLVTGFLVWRIVFVSLLMMGGCVGLYLWELGHGASLAQARTVVVNTLVISHVAYLFNTRRLGASALCREGFTGNRVALLGMLAALLCQGALTYWNPLQAWFGTAALGWDAWARIAGFGVMLFLAVESEKAWRRRRGRPARGAGASVT
ncbi:HAD-IC family P-type ATPase [Massilia violaceinigra]|uniref:HAD-IC family P-type ATPase n=1 Tax=Massilia violaceinigra TaxID=2045208 RepID=A0ABY4A4A7_9BURK|nr:HAD-IC family P-type ATPase [Massilia violaceinigra]UOD28995.1 HAD-IC family P-type ATPase [Massilia violaceinigra]